MDKTERQQLTRVIEDLRRWADEAMQIRLVASALPVSGPIRLAEHDEHLLSQVESSSAGLDLASLITRPGWLLRRKKDPATDEAQRLVAVHDSVLSCQGHDRTAVLLRWLSERTAAEAKQLQTAVQDLRHWRIQAADARRLSSQLPVSGSTLLKPDEEKLVFLVEQVRHDIDVAAHLVGQAAAGEPSDPVAASASARRVVEAHAKVVSAYGVDRIDSVRRLYYDRASSERRRLSTAAEAMRLWVPQVREVRFVAAHLPTSGSLTLGSGDEQLVSLVQGVKDDVGPATRLVAAADLVTSAEFGTVSSAARRLTEAYERIVSTFGIEAIDVLRRRYLDRAAAERQTLGDAIRDIHYWAEHALEIRRTCSHLPVSASIALEPHEEQLVALIESAATDVDAAAPLSRPLRFPSPVDFDASHAAAGRLIEAHRRIAVLHKLEGPERFRWKYHHRAAAERDQVARAIEELELLHKRAEKVIHAAAHLPLSASDVLDAGLRSDLQGVVESYGASHGRARHVVADDVCGNAECEAFHAAADQIVRVHAVVVGDGLPEVVVARLAELDARTAAERKQLSVLLGALSTIRHEGAELVDAAAHLPINRPGMLGEQLSQTTALLIDRIDARWRDAERLAVGDICESGGCAAAHAAAVALADTHAKTVKTDVLAEIRERRTAVDRQATEDRSTLNGLRKQVARWKHEVSAIRAARQNAAEVIMARVASMRASAVPVVVGRSRLDLIPLGHEDKPVLAPLRLLADQPISRQDDGVLTYALTLSNEIERIRGDLDDKWSCDRRCGGTHKTLAEAVSRAPAVQHDLDRLKPAPAGPIESFDLLIDPAAGFASYLPTGSWPTDLLDPSLTASACARASDLAFPAKAVEAAAKFAKSVAEEIRAADVVSALRGMDLEVLRKASGLKVRIAPLGAVGLDSVWDVLKYTEKNFLEDLPGLGESSARSIEQAALRLKDAVRDETPVRIDVKKRGKRTTRLLEALRDWDLSRRDDPTIDEQALAKAFIALGKATTPKQVLVIAKQRSDGPDVAALERDHLDRRFPELESGIWHDFLARPAEYFGMLSELGFVTEDEKKMHGDLPEEIIEAVRAKELNRDFLTAKLRAYQSFGARFVLVQKKAVIGDEMGLGKTVEALAVMAHLRATGQTHFIVVCPAAVVSNWMRETAEHAKLRAHRLQGNQWERTAAAKSWVRNGGVAVVTYDLLGWARPFVRQADLGCAVFDEAHYIKNPLAKRSLEAQDLMDAVGYVMLMTGTPLENSVQEFRNIIGYIRPALADSAPDYLPSKFRKNVAPAYLRRNQEDVLTELPELVEVDDWLPMSTADEKDYRSAVEGGSFMLMRRSAMLSSDSAKLGRLVEIVTEAEANDRRVIVFSYFREVLDAVDRAIPGKVFGPLTGSVPAAQRQVLVDQFSRAAGGAVLVAQIGAGGVGLNIQSASVVVICEPQLKPTTEAQAIARAHRMGQTTTVQVHRLLTEDSVDERIREILAEKRSLFDNFARDSVIAKTAPDAVDVSDSELARLVVAAERERLLGTA